MRLFLFDGFVLHEDEQHVALPPQAQRLIAFVTLRRTVSRDEVRCALWPDISDDRASARLRTTLWRLREPGRGVLNTTNGQLSLAEDIDVDVRNWMALAVQVIDQPGSVATLDLASLRRCGELLPGWYDDWVLLERERARQLQLHVLEIVADELIGWVAPRPRWSLQRVLCRWSSCARAPTALSSGCISPRETSARPGGNLSAAGGCCATSWAFLRRTSCVT